MPSSNTWWWIGIGTGVAALTGTGVALIYRGRKKSTLGGIDRTPSPFPPVPPPRPGIDEDQDIAVSIPAIPNQIRDELCRQWSVGTYRPDWRPELTDYIDTAVNAQIAKRDTSWSTMDELETKSFRVAKAAMRSVCPEIPLPDSLTEIELESEFQRFYWQELWALFWDRAYNRIGDFSF